LKGQRRNATSYPLPEEETSHPHGSEKKSVPPPKGVADAWK